MTERLLDSKQSHFLRWLVLIPLSLALASVAATLAFALVPEDLYRRIPENAKFLMVVAVAAVGCVVLEWRLRRRQRE
jgi:uncharacterized membrane protein YadS